MLNTTSSRASMARDGLLEIINMNKNQIKKYTDRFSKQRPYVKTADSDLLDLWVDTVSGQKFMRLLTINPITWKNTEILWANQLIESIKKLKRKKREPKVVLALLAYGYRCKSIKPALDELGKAVKKGKHKMKLTAKKLEDAEVEITDSSAAKQEIETAPKIDGVSDALASIEEQAIELS